MVADYGHIDGRPPRPGQQESAGPILTFPTPSFTEFITAVKADAFSR